tara:strand:- start:2678 stop:3757 length:1080 start_codon:yes stop_codon:yes gene_type:complete
MALIKLNTRSIPDDAVTPDKVSNNLGRRNMIINGDFQVWQKGNTITANAETTADRWLGYSTNSGVGNPGMIANKGTGTTAIAEYGNYAEVKFVSGDTGINYLTFGQRIESLVTRNQLTAGDKVTFSCYIKRKQNAASSIKVHVRYPSGGVDSYQSGRTLLGAYDTAVATPYTNTFNSLPLNTWVRISGTFDANSAMANRGCAVFLENGPSDLGVNNGDTIYETTGWQLEKGDTATSYEHRNIAEELASCQRYFYSLTNYSTGYICPLWQYNSNATINGWVKFPTTMRVEPSLIYNTTGQTNWIVAYGNGVGLSMNTFTLNEQTLDSAVLYNAQANVGQGNAGGFYCASTSAAIHFDSEI